MWGHSGESAHNLQQVGDQVAERAAFVAGTFLKPVHEVPGQGGGHPLRFAAQQSDAGTAAAGPVKGCENAVISSSQVDWSRVEVLAQPPNLRPQIAAQVQQALQICCKYPPQGLRGWGSTPKYEPANRPCESCITWRRRYCLQPWAC